MKHKFLFLSKITYCRQNRQNNIPLYYMFHMLFEGKDYIYYKRNITRLGMNKLLHQIYIIHLNISNNLYSQIQYKFYLYYFIKKLNYRQDDIIYILHKDFNILDKKKSDNKKILSCKSKSLFNLLGSIFIK